ncbi:MAG: TonB family protein [candidate division NC10 bacterium]
MTQPFRLTSNRLLKGIGRSPAPLKRQEPRQEAAGKEFRETVDPASSVPPKAAPNDISDGRADSQVNGRTGAQIGSSDAPPGTTGSGEAGGGTWLHLSRLPRLANKADLERALRRYYPEEERRKGREAEVTLHLHVDAHGRVSAFDIVRSGGPAFDEAAAKVAGVLEFVPAMAGQLPAAVKVKQTISFRLKD